MNEKNNKSSLINLDLWIKWIGAGVVFSGVYGVGIQKGMISQMGLGNLRGNYELREIFNSALDGGLYTFNILSKVLEDTILNEFQTSALVFGALFAVVGLMVAIVLNMETVRSAKSSKCKKIRLRTIISPSKWSFALYPIIGILTALIISVGIVIFRYIIFFLLAAVLLINLIGNITGEGMTRETIASNPCKNVDKEIRKAKRVHQCTQITINGKLIKGDILLENEDGYFLKRNDSYSFIRKDGAGCIFSKFLINTETDFETADFSFKTVDPELISFCGFE